MTKLPPLISMDSAASLRELSVRLGKSIVAPLVAMDTEAAYRKLSNQRLSPFIALDSSVSQEALLGYLNSSAPSQGGGVDDPPLNAITINDHSLTINGHFLTLGA